MLLQPAWEAAVVVQFSTHGGTLPMDVGKAGEDPAALLCAWTQRNEDTANNVKTIVENIWDPDVGASRQSKGTARTSVAGVL